MFAVLFKILARLLAVKATAKVFVLRGLKLALKGVPVSAGGQIAGFSKIQLVRKVAGKLNLNPRLIQMVLRSNVGKQIETIIKRKLGTTQGAILNWILKKMFGKTLDEIIENLIMGKAVRIDTRSRSSWVEWVEFRRVKAIWASGWMRMKVKNYPTIYSFPAIPIFTWFLISDNEARTHFLHPFAGSGTQIHSANLIRGGTKKSQILSSWFARNKEDIYRRSGRSEWGRKAKAAFGRKMNKKLEKIITRRLRHRLIKNDIRIY